MRNRCLSLLPKAAVGIFLLGFGACASAPRLRTANTATEQWYALKSNRERVVASNFYRLGSADEVQSLYWARRNMVGGPGSRSAYSAADAKPKDDGLKRRYVNLPVPAFRDEDGTVREEHLESFEVVQ